MDIAEVQTEEGRLYLFAAIDRSSKFAYAQLHIEATRATARSFYIGTKQLGYLIATAADFYIKSSLADSV